MAQKKKFDPNAAADKNSGIFGLAETRQSSTLCLLPVPWDVTTSYRPGTSRGPEAILNASLQVDLYDRELGVSYVPGIYMFPIPQQITKINATMRKKAETVIKTGGRITKQNKKNLMDVNKACHLLNDFVYSQTLTLLSEGKKVGVIGGDHAVPYGAIRAMGEHHGDFGILHFDAHSDLRDAYEGFQHSHASIMNNVIRDFSFVKKLVQVGIRDFCEQEVEFGRTHSERIKIYYDSDLTSRLLDGARWSDLCREVVAQLPRKVYVSFDIDGLQPALCPHTGTPVPGGLTLHQAVHMIGEVRKQQKEIIGFDLVEVAPNLKDKTDEWDANVGARLLYKICGLAS